MTPDEVWCRRCDKPAVREVAGSAYCERHAGEAEWLAIQVRGIRPRKKGAHL